MTQLKKRLREAVIRIAKDAAFESTQDTILVLKATGPYWSGLFEASWTANNSRTPVEDRTPRGPQIPRPRPRTLTAFRTPPPRLVGTRINYVIGNTTEYRAIATDLLPGRNAEGNTVNFVPKNWYEVFALGDSVESLNQVIARATTAAFRKNGFTQ